MIMAARTRDSDSEKSLRHDVDAIVDDVVLHALEPFANGEKSERREVALVLRTRGQLVGGNLFGDEDVVRLVLVKTSNHVIAIGPRKRIQRILPLAANLPLRVGIARGVEPVTAPALAVMR